MANFKPQITYMTKASLNAYYNASSYIKPLPSKSIVKQFKTYKLLLKEIKQCCEDNIELDGVQVIRSRRGQWGEWFETWKLNASGEPEIVKEGWM